MELAAPHVDIVRLGWGSALITGALEEKLAVYREHDVAPMLGGTLTELAWRHGRIAELREALLRLDIHHVEVSEGTLDLPARGQAQADRRAARGLHGLRRGRLQGRPARTGRRAVDPPGLRGAGRRRPLDRLRGPRLRRRRPLLARRVDPRRADRGAGRRHRRRAADLRGAAALPAGLARAPLRARRQPRQHPPADLIAVESLRLGLRSDTLTRFHA